MKRRFLYLLACWAILPPAALITLNMAASACKVFFPKPQETVTQYLYIQDLSNEQLRNEVLR